MKKIIGNKKTFAVEFEIIEFSPKLLSKSIIWINKIKIGNFDEVGYLAPLLNSLNRIVERKSNLWDNELGKLNCKEIFYKIIPFYNNPNSFYDLSIEEQESFIKFDKYIFDWGDGFNDWILRVLVKKDICKFLWVHTPLGDEDSFSVRNDIKCFDVAMSEIELVYNEFITLVPEEAWPTLIKK